MERLAPTSAFEQLPTAIPPSAIQQPPSGEIVAAEEQPEFVLTTQQLKPAARVTRSRERIQQAQTILATEFTELDLMPVRCYSCGKVLQQLVIEQSLKSGQSLRETMDQLGYRRICCRSIIMASPSVVKLQKLLNSYEQTARALQNLTLAGTSGMVAQQFPIEPENIEGAHILESVPPSIPQQGGICFPQADETFLESGTIGPDAYEYFMRQLDPGGAGESGTEWSSS